MPWFYNSYSGELAEESGLAAIAYEVALHTGTGWHEYATKADALAAIAANHWPPPTGSLVKGLEQGAGSAAKSVIGSGFHLVFGNTAGLLGRILKVGIGVILLVAGILKLSGTDRKLEAVLPVVGGPAGKVLRA